MSSRAAWRPDHKRLQIHFVPVQHWSARALSDDNQSLWGGWALRHHLRRRFGGFDLAAIPIGAYAPRWFMKIMHLHPAEAVRVHQDINARRSLGIHWGTFENLTDESLYEPP